MKEEKMDYYNNVKSYKHTKIKIGRGNNFRINDLLVSTFLCYFLSFCFFLII